jgi:hypothetical protein
LVAYFTSVCGSYTPPLILLALTSTAVEQSSDLCLSHFRAVQRVDEAPDTFQVRQFGAHSFSLAAGIADLIDDCFGALRTTSCSERCRLRSTGVRGSPASAKYDRVPFS